MSVQGIISKCQKYDMGAHSVESCIPRTMSNIKKLYKMINECEKSGVCDVQSPGFVRSFLLGILESNTNLSSDIDTYLTDILHIPYESRQNPETGFFETDTSKRADKIDDKEFSEYYRSYDIIINKIDQMLLLPDNKVIDIHVSELKKLLEDYLEVAIAFCVYVSKLEDVEMNFRVGCKDLKRKPRN
jgi:hypothetical protein